MVSVKLIKFLDKYFGFFSCLILSLNKIFPKKKYSEYKKILVLQLWGVGETTLTLPTIKELRKNFGNSKIEILTTKRVRDIYFNNKNINNLKVLNLNPFSIKLFILKNFRKYDLVIDMEEYLNISSIISFVGKERIGYSHGIRSNLYTKTVRYDNKQHLAQTYMDLLKPLGIKKTVKNLEKLNYSNADKKTVDNLLKNIGKNIVGIGFGAAESVKERMWPKERFAKVADYLIEKYNAKIILIGNKNEEKLGNEILNLIKNKDNAFNAAGKTTLREMFYLISLCKLFIGNDSGPMHVAAAQNVKTIGLFGCNLPVRFAPFGKNNIGIRKQTAKPCINVHKGDVGKCKFGMENACVKKIKVEDVVKLISKFKQPKI